MKIKTIHRDGLTWQNKSYVIDRYMELAEQIDKMLEGAVEVYGPIGNSWDTINPNPGTNWVPHNKALLINIEPIAKESAEDILRWIRKEGEFDWREFNRRVSAVLGEE